MSSSLPADRFDAPPTYGFCQGCNRVEIITGHFSTIGGREDSGSMSLCSRCTYETCMRMLMESDEQENGIGEEYNNNNDDDDDEDDEYLHPNAQNNHDLF